jgi:hypothetical protein
MDRRSRPTHARHPRDPAALIEREEREAARMATPISITTSSEGEHHG